MCSLSREPDQLRRNAGVNDVEHEHRVPRRPPPLSRRARIEDPDLPHTPDLRLMRVAIDDGGAMGEAPRESLFPPGARAGVSVIPMPGPPASTTSVSGSRTRSAASSMFPWTPCTGGPSAASSSNADAAVTSPAWRIRSAVRRRSTQISGSCRPPRGRCVSAMTATSTARARPRGRRRRASRPRSEPDRRPAARSPPPPRRRPPALPPPPMRAC